jgi:hypothetical protein
VTTGVPVVATVDIWLRHLVPDLLHGLAELVVVAGRLRIELDYGPLAGQKHLGGAHAGPLGQRLLDGARASRAVHPLDGEFDSVYVSHELFFYPRPIRVRSFNRRSSVKRTR